MIPTYCKRCGNELVCEEELYEGCTVYEVEPCGRCLEEAHSEGSWNAREQGNRQISVLKSVLQKERDDAEHERWMHESEMRKQKKEQEDREWHRRLGLPW